MPSGGLYATYHLLGEPETTIEMSKPCSDLDVFLRDIPRIASCRLDPDLREFAEHITRWWFQIFFIFTPTWGKFPFWLIFFKWVETTFLIKIFRTRYRITSFIGCIPLSHHAMVQKVVVFSFDIFETSVTLLIFTSTVSGIISTTNNWLGAHLVYTKRLKEVVVLAFSQQETSKEPTENYKLTANSLKCAPRTVNPRVPACNTSFDGEKVHLDVPGS